MNKFLGSALVVILLLVGIQFFYTPKTASTIESRLKAIEENFSKMCGEHGIGCDLSNQLKGHIFYKAIVVPTRESEKIMSTQTYRQLGIAIIVSSVGGHSRFRAIPKDYDTKVGMATFLSIPKDKYIVTVAREEHWGFDGKTKPQLMCYRKEMDFRNVERGVAQQIDLDLSKCKQGI